MATHPKNTRSATGTKRTPTSESLDGPQFAPVQPILRVQNVQKAVDTYTKLGFEIATTMPSLSGKGLGHAIVRLGSSMVHVEALSGLDAPPASSPREKATQKGPRGLGVALYVMVPNVEKVHETLRRNALEVTEAPTEKFWGDRVCTAVDPFGFEWTFAQHIRDVSPEEMAEAAAKLVH